MFRTVYFFFFCFFCFFTAFLLFTNTLFINTLFTNTLSTNALFADTVFDEAADIRKAVAAAAPRLVCIETVGGHEKVGSEFANEGTSAGILLDKDGFVITAAFNLLHNPSSILLRFSDNTKKVAKIIATDRSRMLALLKVEELNVEGLNAALSGNFDYRSKDSLQTGERCIVLGTALINTAAPDEPNIAAGIISGKDRIWGKAVQTDAAVGPNNYGGAVIDRDGRFIAVAVPLSMTSDEVAAGADLYDSGIGLGIPFEDIFRIVLPKLKEGKDLEPAYFGFGLKDNRVFISEAVLDGVAAGSPAEKAGLKTGDKITAVNGQAVHSCMELAMFTRECYAGEKVQLKYLRSGNETQIETQTELETAVQPKK